MYGVTQTLQALIRLGLAGSFYSSSRPEPTFHVSNPRAAVQVLDFVSWLAIFDFRLVRGAHHFEPHPADPWGSTFNTPRLLLRRRYAAQICYRAAKSKTAPAKR